MRICFITHCVHPTAGGSTKYFYEITQRLKKQGNQIYLVCTEGSCSTDINVDGLIFVKKITLPYFKGIFGNFFQKFFVTYILTTMLFGLFAFLKIKRRNFDIYCFESGYMGFWILAFKLFRKRPLVSFSMRYGWRMFLYSIKNKYKKTNFDFILYLIWELIFFINEFIDVHFSDRVIVLNKEAKEIWIDSAVNPNKIYVVPYGIDLSKYFPTEKNSKLCEKYELRKGEKVILYLGHLQPLRYVDKLLKAFSFLTKLDVKLLIIGSGPVKEKLEQLAIDLNIADQVKFIPHIHEERILNTFINLADIMVIPHPPGTVVLLGAACGLPVITIKNDKKLLGAIDEKLLSHFILLESNKPFLIAKACYELLENEKKRFSKSQELLEIIKNYSWDSVSKILFERLQTTYITYYKYRNVSSNELKENVG